MTLFTEIIRLAQSDLSNFEIDTVDGLPCHGYLKAKNGSYLSCTDEQAKAVGLEKRSDLIGLTDADVLYANEAANFRVNDKKVMLTKRSLVTTELFSWFDGRRVEATSIKTPLRAKYSKRIIGIAGISILKYANFDLPEEYASLTNRQIDCLFYLAKAYSLKQIAIAMKLSPRTIEHHLEAIKTKFNCHLRSDLVAIALLIPSIRNRL